VSAPRGWAVVGLGRAGLAKARALLGPLAAEEGARLVATCSRRGALRDLASDLDPEGAVRALTLEEALADPRVEAVAVCTESALHAAQARAALAAGRHALVDFPLCATRAEAESLLALADARGLTLHHELIGLLAQGHRALAAQAAAARAAGDPLGALSLRQTGGLYRWVREEVEAKRLGQLCVGRLHQAWDLAGPLSLVHAARAPVAGAGDGAYALTLALRGAGGEEVTLVESRAEGLGRAGEVEARTRGGRALQSEGRGAPGDLFAEDLRAFYAEVRGAPPYAPRAHTLGVLALAEQVSAAL